jgi:hypothetical protein
MMANLLLLGGDGAFPGQGRTGKNDRTKKQLRAWAKRSL